MGKIVRNGIEFSSTSDTADNINYNNSKSGLEAMTVQEAVDELSNRVTNDSLGEDENGMTVHEKLNFLMENGIKGDYEIAYFGQNLTFDSNTNMNYTFQKNYKKVYVILIGGRTDGTAIVNEMTFSNGAIAVLDYNQAALSTVGSTKYVTRAYVAHTETEVTEGTVLTASLNYNAWYHNTLIIFGKE